MRGSYFLLPTRSFEPTASPCFTSFLLRWGTFVREEYMHDLLVRNVDKLFEVSLLFNCLADEAIFGKKCAIPMARAVSPPTIASAIAYATYLVRHYLLRQLSKRC